MDDDELESVIALDDNTKHVDPLGWIFWDMGSDKLMEMAVGDALPIMLRPNGPISGWYDGISSSLRSSRPPSYEGANCAPPRDWWLLRLASSGIPSDGSSSAA